MSEEYKSDVELNGNPNGTVSFATEVLATIAGLAVNEVEGVASMSSSNSGIAEKMFGRKAARSFTKGVRVAVDDRNVSVDVSIVVEYGSPVPEVARGIQENVKKAMETMSGLNVLNVNVHIAGVSFEKENKAVAELTEQHKKLLERADEEPAEEETAEELAEESEAEPEADEEA